MGCCSASLDDGRRCLFLSGLVMVSLSFIASSPAVLCCVRGCASVRRCAVLPGSVSLFLLVFVLFSGIGSM